jgi:hypothetical protein
MAKRKQRALAQKRTASKRGKARTKVTSAKRTKASAKKTAHRVAMKTKRKKQAIKPRARRAGPKKAAPKVEAADETVIVNITEESPSVVAVVTEFESVQTSEPDAPGPG